MQKDENRALLAQMNFTMRMEKLHARCVRIVEKYQGILGTDGQVI